MPSGHDSETVRQLYDHMYAQYYDRYESAWIVNWSQVGAIFAWGILLITFFALYSYLQSRPRSRGDLYPPASFASEILERNGVPSLFQFAVWIGTTGWALFFVISHAVHGQIY